MADWCLSAELQEKACIEATKSSPPPTSKLDVPLKADASDEPEEINAAELSVMHKFLRTQLVQVTSEIETVRNNPNSPFYSAKSFEELNLSSELLKGVYNMGFNQPSKIQEEALAISLSDPPINLIAQSQSGTDKTTVLAALSRINPNLKYPHVLILTPLYEQAIEIGRVAEKMAQFCPYIQICFAIHGEVLEKGHKITENFLIGTPGKVFDWTFRYKFFDLKKIQVFVLDEADFMLSTQGYEDQTIRIVKQLSRKCQMLLFSFTYTEEVMRFAEQIIQDPVILKRKREEILDNIKQFYVVSTTQKEKFEALCYIYGTVFLGQGMIFCHTKKTAAWLSEKMAKEGHDVALLSGDLTCKQRVAVLNRFREGKEKVLITTNVSLGVNVENVTVVINFDLPMNQNNEADYSTYLRRIEKTGRFGKSGLVINLVDGNRSMAILKQIEQYFEKPILKVNGYEVDVKNGF